jgi:hypothetical protein
MRRGTVLAHCSIPPSVLSADNATWSISSLIQINWPSPTVVRTPDPVGAISDEGRVVRDGYVITGGSVTAGIDFALVV